MDLWPSSFSVYVMMICLPGAPCCDEIDFPCPEIPTWNLTKPPPRTCFRVNDNFRYACIEGYLRKAGTSSLTRCRLIDSVPQWTPASLQCIPDPRRATTRPPKTTMTTAAGLTSRQTTCGLSTSVTDSADAATASGPRAPSDPSRGFVNTTEAANGTTSTSTTADPSIRRDHPLMTQPGSVPTASIAVASLLILCALIGVSFFCYRRSRSHGTRIPAEEQMPMNQAPPAVV